jgi:hypothetical protein
LLDDQDGEHGREDGSDVGDDRHRGRALKLGR